MFFNIEININIKLSIYNPNFGVYKWTNLNSYEGKFKDGKMIGKGVFKWVGDCIYEGE